MQNFKLLILLLLFPVIQFSQTISGYKDIQGKNNYKDPQHFTKAVTFAVNPTVDEDPLATKSYVDTYVSTGRIWVSPVEDIVDSVNLPASPDTNSRWINSTDNKIYTFDGASYTSETPFVGTTCYVKNDSLSPTNYTGIYTYSDTSWVYVFVMESLVETDPYFTGHVSYDITETDMANWDSAYSQRSTWNGGSKNLVPSTGRTSLGATTVGSNLFTLTNPSSISFLRVNANNTVSQLSATDFRTAIGVGSAEESDPIYQQSVQSEIDATDTTRWGNGYLKRLQSLTTTGNSGAATLTNNVLNVPTYTLSGLGGVSTQRTLTINGQAWDLSANRSWIINPMEYPGAGIALSTGSGWGTSITNNSTNWDAAYANRIASLTTTGSYGAATFTSNTLNIPNYTLTGLGGVPRGRILTINGTSYDLTEDRTWSTAPTTQGIAISTGSVWGTSITNNSVAWDTAYARVQRWNNSPGLDLTADDLAKYDTCYTAYSQGEYIDDLCPMLTDSTTSYVTPHQLADSLDNLHIVEINSQISSYALVLSDVGKVITIDTTADKIITVPANASVAFEVGTQIDIVNLGLGDVLMIPASGVTINSRNGYKIKQYGRCRLLKMATNTWILSGDVNSTLYDNLISYWNFNEPSGSTVSDKYGYNNATAVLGGTSTLGSTGKIGLCPTFDGSNDSIYAGNPVNLQVTFPVSFSFWLYPTEETTDYWYPIITKIKSDRNGYAIWFYNNRIAFESADGSSSINSDSNPYVTELNTWHHIVVTWDGDFVNYYINGTWDSEEAQTLTPVVNVNNFMIGTTDSDPTAGFKGRIDEVKIWNKVLSATEVTEDYNNSNGKVL